MRQKSDNASRLYLSVLALAASLPWASASAGVLVLAAHPDDDVVTAAGVINRAVGFEEVTVVFVTNGDVNGTSQGYLRQGEAVKAQVENLGTSEDDLIFLGYPDGRLKEVFDNYTSVSS